MEELMEGQVAAGGDDEDEDEEEDSDEDTDEETDDSETEMSKLAISKKPAKKETLTKAQKRRQWDQAATGGERPRGWDWVDICKHLAQVGNKDEAGAIPQNYDGWWQSLRAF